MTLNCLLQLEFDKTALSVVEALEPGLRSQGSIRLMKVLTSYAVTVLYIPVGLVSPSSVCSVILFIILVLQDNVALVVVLEKLHNGSTSDALESRICVVLYVFQFQQFCFFNSGNADLLRPFISGKHPHTCKSKISRCKIISGTIQCVDLFLLYTPI